ncbi:MAG TPA: cation diffusion facilitator family transporter [Pyrinomonadaceae bacterium]|jgi:cobalt-zinc-cadmium efflux system protein
MAVNEVPVEIRTTHAHGSGNGGGAHSHGAHKHGRAERSRRRLSVVLLLTGVYMLAEAFGGWWTGSLTLLADAGHMLADVAALALALVAIWFGSRPATPNKTFGYYRLEILAAWINGVALVVIALVICYEAYERWASPPEVKSTQMLIIATGGLLINATCAWLLHGEHEHDLNMRGAWLHIIGDALGSVGAIIAGALMSIYGWYMIDPLVSVLIGLLIVWSSWNLIRVSTNVLLEGTPAHINLAAVEEAILKTDGVQDVHDLHVWTITSGREALSAHVIHMEAISQPELLKELRAKLYEKFGVDHLTIQMETPDYEDETFHFCHTGMACFRSERE